MGGARDFLLVMCGGSEDVIIRRCGWDYRYYFVMWTELEISSNDMGRAIDMSILWYGRG